MDFFQFGFVFLRKVQVRLTGDPGSGHQFRNCSTQVHTSTTQVPFSKHVSSLKAKFFSRLKALRCISASSWDPSKESLPHLYKSFLRPLLTYASPGWFPFLSATNITKLERLHRAASHAINGCLLSPLSLFSPRLLYLPYESL